MLKFYISSVIIYIIIIFAVVTLFKDLFDKNCMYIGGVTSEIPKKGSVVKRLKYLIILSAVPIVRTFVVILVVWISFAKKETLDKFKEAATKKS